jgi:hypothetical protein
MNDKNCWSCAHHDINSQQTLIGNCTKITRNNVDGCKEIPPHIVDSGCKFWKTKEIK